MNWAVYGFAALLIICGTILVIYGEKGDPTAMMLIMGGLAAGGAQKVAQSNNTAKEAKQTANAALEETQTIKRNMDS